MSGLRLVASIAICIVMVLVTAAPLAIAGTHEVVKDEQGPRASAVSWEYVPTGLGNWSGHIVNNGLRWLVVEVYDNTTGAMDQVLHERIRFAPLGAFPNGEVDTSVVVMSPSHKYTIIAIPNGPMGSSCTVEDVFVGPIAPVATFLVTVDYMTVSVDSSGSSDPDGTIVAFDWTFGDGGTASGAKATHTYTLAGTYTITLTLTDNDGLKGSMSQLVTVYLPPPPMAAFTYTVSGTTVYVNAAGSSGYGLSYAWDWGDGTTGSGMTASHTYGTPAPAPASVPSMTSSSLFSVFGTVYLPDGVTPAAGTVVTVTNLRSGYSETMISYDGFYMTSLVEVPGGPPDSGGPMIGDTINVTAVKDSMIGWNEGIVVVETPYLWLDVTLSGPGYKITLTVTDTMGRTSTVYEWVPVIT